MRVLLVEDSERLCETLAAGLGKLGFAVDVVRDGRRGLSYARLNPYDVVILDLMLPEMDGISVLRQLRAHGSETCVLILTARDRAQDRVLGLQAGADDYLVKPFDFDELVARLRALVRRRYAKRNPAIDLGSLTLDSSAGVLLQGDRPVSLTPQEYALLEFLAYRKGEVVSRVEIEDAVYDEHSLPNGNAVDSSICRLRAKLAQFEGGPEIETHRGRGYALVTSEA